MPIIVALLVVLGLIPAWIVCNWQALVSLHHRWLLFDEPYAIGYPAVALSLGWVWRHRSLLLRQRIKPSLLALLALCLVLIGSAAAQLVQLLIVQEIAAFFSLWLILVALLGWPAGRFFIFPFALLALTVPVWDFLVDPMRAMTVLFTQHMLDILRIPARIGGFLIGLPGGVIEVAGGCSGLNLFLAMTLVGLLFAESQHTPLPRRVAVVMLAGFFGIVENWIRVFVLVLVAYRTNLKSDFVLHHGSFGWWIYAVGLLPYFWLAARIEGRKKQPASAPNDTVPSLQWQPSVSLVARIVAIIVAMSAVIAIADRFEHRRGNAEHGFAATAGFFPIAPAIAWMPQYSGQDVTQAWRARRNGADYDVVALTYVEQRQNKKLIYFSNRLANEHAVHDSGRMIVSQNFAVNTATVFGNGWRAVWWFWWVDGATSTSALGTKFLQLRAMLFGDPSAALIAVSVACIDDGCEKTMVQNQADITALLTEIRQWRAL